MFIPAPGIVPGRFDRPGVTLTDYVDREVLPGRLIFPQTDKDNDEHLANAREPEGLLSTIAAVATALIGVLAGQWLRESQRNGHVKALALLLAGLGCLAVGGFWDHWLPINKSLWTSSFTLWTAGWSLLLLGLFYLVIDVWGCRKWAFFFVVIGMNAITIYGLKEFGVDFESVGKLVFGRLPIAKELLAPVGTIAVEWLFLYVLYRNRIILRL